MRGRVERDSRPWQQQQVVTLAMVAGLLLQGFLLRHFPSEVKEEQLEVVHGSHGKGSVPIHCPVGTAFLRSEPGRFLRL